MLEPAIFAVTLRVEVTGQILQEAGSKKPKQLVSLSLLSMSWYIDAGMQFGRYEAYNTLKEDQLFHYSQDMFEKTRELRLCRFSKVSKSFLDISDKKDSEQQLDINEIEQDFNEGDIMPVNNDSYSIDSQPDKFLKSMVQLFPNIRSASFWLTPDPSLMLEYIGKYYPKVRHIELECIFSGWPYDIPTWILESFGLCRPFPIS